MKIPATIHLLDSSDISTLVSFFCFPWSSIEETKKKWEHYYLEHLKNIRTTITIKNERKILGYGSLLRSSEYPHFSGIPEINDVWIDEFYRKQGLGQKLIEWLEKLAYKEGFKQIGLGVGLYKDYGPAQKLYFRLGYRPDGLRITYKYKQVTPGEKYSVDDDLLL